MRAAALLLVLAVMTACGDVGTAERLSSKEAIAGIDVPTIGTVGDFPDPAHRHIVNVSADGRVVVEGRVVTNYGELRAETKRLGALSDGEAIPGTSPVKHLSGESFVLRVDRSVSWNTTFLAFAACSESNSERVFFAVHHESGGDEGAMAMFLPTDVGCGDDGRVLSRRVAISRRAGAATPADLYEYVRASPATQTRGLRLSIVADPDLPTGTVLAFIDALLRSDAEFSGIDWPTTPPRLDAALPFAAASSSKTVAARIDDQELRTDPTAQMPPVARVRGGLAGIARSWHTAVRARVETTPSPDPNRR